MKGDNKKKERPSMLTHLITDGSLTVDNLLEDGRIKRWILDGQYTGWRFSLYDGISTEPPFAIFETTTPDNILPKFFATTGYKAYNPYSTHNSCAQSKDWCAETHNTMNTNTIPKARKQKCHRKHFPAFRQDMAAELKICRLAMKQPSRSPRDRIVISGVILGLKLALRIFKRNTLASQQALWTDTM